MLWAFQIEPNGSPVSAEAARWIELRSPDYDFAHLTSHMPFELHEVSPWLPDRRTYPPHVWKLMRQDDNGQVFEIQSFTTACEARAAAAKFEVLGHKQMYWVDGPAI